MKPTISVHCRNYSKALEGGSHDDVVLVNRGLAREMVGEREGGMADLTAALSLNPHAAHAYFNRGNMHRCHGDLQGAQQDYQSGKMFRALFRGVLTLRPNMS